MSDRKRRFTVESLFTDTRPQAAGVNELPGSSLIALNRIDPDPDQPRRTFDEERLEELAASIRIEGVLQPIVVRYDITIDRYIVVHGERRWRASQLAGLSDIPALVRDVPAERRLIQQLMENIVRDDLNPVDRSAALRMLKEQLGDPPWETVAETVGIKRSRLFQLLSTEKLPDAIQHDIRSGVLSEKQSRMLQNLDPHAQAVLRDLIVAGEQPSAKLNALARDLRDMPAFTDEAAARATIGDLLAGATANAVPAASAQASARELLSLLTEVARGKSESAASLAESLAALPPVHYSARRLEKSLLGQASLLAALHTAPAKERERTRPELEALRDALNALLDSN